MTSSTFKVKHTFLAYFILLIVLLNSLLIYPADYIKDDLPKYLGSMIFVAFIIATFFISYYLTRVKLIIKIQGVDVTIAKQSGLFQYTPKKFSINKVEYYLLNYDSKYATLKLQIKDKPIIKILKLDIFDDDFEKFTNKLIKLIESTKNEAKAYNKRVPTLFETNSGLWVAIVLGILSLLIIIFGKGIGRFVAFPAVGFFIFQVITYRKNNAK